MVLAYQHLTEYTVSHLICNKGAASCRLYIYYQAEEVLCECIRQIS
jgi:hypothetical protein